MQTDQAYTSIGKMVPSQKPSAPRATFGKFEKSKFNKQLEEKQFMKAYTGREGQGPAAYLPSRYQDKDGN